MTTLILVRHGETEGNVQQVWHGAWDSPLTKRGQLQVQATAVRIAQFHLQHAIKALYVSPLPRAQHTAAAIAAAIGLQPVIDAGLREFDLGEWEGRTFADLRHQENLWERWRQDPSFTPPQGESPRSFHARVVAALTRLTAQHPAQTIVAVTHGGVISNLLATWLGQGPEEWRQWEAHNCAITLLQKGETQWQALQVNDITHLPAEAIYLPDASIYA